MPELSFNAQVRMVNPCPHCPDAHGSPHRASWGVRVDELRDGDGQPVRLIVQPSDGAHVAEEDAVWLFLLIQRALASCDHVGHVSGMPSA